MADMNDPHGPLDLKPFTVRNPEMLAANMIRLMELGNKALQTMMEGKKTGAGPWSLVNEMGEAGKVFSTVLQHWMQHPAQFAATQTKLNHELIDLWGRTYRRFLGENVEPLIRPAPGDNRFQHPDWTEKPLFDFCKQAYLLTCRWAESLVEMAPDIDDRFRQRARFNVNLITSALSPTNFPVTNPEVLRITAEENAENLVKGMSQLVEDLTASGDLLRIRQTDMKAFAVGKNLAVTPGKVIFQNDIFQLIQYSPSTGTVFETPLLIVPPWINKFYILDLVPQKSFIKWLVDQGFTVFVMSWVNPDARLAHKTFEDYMQEGILVALETVQQAAQTRKVNTLGYCVGGTLLASTLAYMAEKGIDSVNSSTFLTTQVDFSRAGDLLIFIDDTQLKALQQMMAERGYLDGSRMAAVFNMLRPRDLIWPYIVNNYLLGKQPFPFDLLYWNSDSTRMAAANHSFYLREFYQQNRLALGQMELGGVRLDLSKITVPVYELAAKEDHIAPAQSVFLGSKLFSGPVRFVLAGSGHIAGVINPPDKNKYMYWTFDTPNNEQPVNLDDWLGRATQFAGSWWPDYGAWLALQSGESVPARQPGTGPFPALEDAPGSYVRVTA